jgi:hypothetical protein
LGFSDTDVISGTVVMAERTDRRDRGKSGILGEVADSGAGAARSERRWPERWWAVPAGFTARAPREGGRGKVIGISGGVIEPSGRVFENTRDLAGDLLRAKNAGVTIH